MTKYKPIKTISINSDEIGYVAYYPQFAYANISQQSRIEAITNIASICYANPKAFGSESLYNRLAAESAGLPSSSFEFVPVLLDRQDFNKCYLSMTGKTPVINITDNNPLTKYGEWIENGHYLLTNFRAVVYLFEQFNIDLRNKFNTKEECDIIAKHFHVFNYNVDMPTRSQMVRHRTSWQELSRRYVSGKKIGFDFYISEKMKFISKHEDGESPIYLDENDFNRICVERYNQALERGVKPEEARRCIPQAAYTSIWGAFQPVYLTNFFKLRLDQHAQKEIREVAQAMQELISTPQN